MTDHLIPAFFRIKIQPGNLLLVPCSGEFLMFPDNKKARHDAGLFRIRKMKRLCDFQIRCGFFAALACDFI